MSASAAPLASVVLCARNEERHLPETLESLKRQTFERFELIVIDDASSDGTSEAVWRANEPRFRLLVNERHEGVAHSRNRGTAAAAAPIIIVSDASDSMMPSRLEEQLGFLDSHPEIGVVGTYMSVLDAAGEPLAELRTPLTDSEIRAAMTSRMPLAHPSMAVRKSLLDACGGYREKFIVAADYDLVSRLAERTQMATIPHSLQSYRLTPHSVSIRHRHMQRHAIELVQRFARERVRGGADSYATLNVRELESLAEPQSEKHLVARYHLFAAKLAATGENFRAAPRHLIRSIRSHPAQIEAYLLLCLAAGGEGLYRAVQRRFGTGPDSA